MKSPAFQFYPADWLSDINVQLLTLEEEGAYIRLICFCWREGSIPKDPKIAALLCKGASPEIVGKVLGLFVDHPEDPLKLIHKRLKVEKCKQEANSLKRSGSGTAGAMKKWGITDAGSINPTRGERLASARHLARHSPEEWQALLGACRHQCVRCGAHDTELVKDHIMPIYKGGSDGIDNLQPLCRTCNSSKGPETIDHRPAGWNAWQTPGSSSSSSSPSTTPVVPKGTGQGDSKRQLDQEALAVYAEYPRKVGKPTALRQIRKSILAHGYDRILELTKNYAMAREGEDQNFTPHPSTWFGQERYEDDSATWKKNGKPAPVNFYLQEMERDNARNAGEPEVPYGPGPPGFFEKIRKQVEGSK